MLLERRDRLGPDEILEPIRAPGMSRVYKAYDTKLARGVALKILPDAFACEHDRVARFQREAQVLASLKDPHIADIYGIEDSGSVPALIMELIEGRTLSEHS